MRYIILLILTFVYSYGIIFVKCEDKCNNLKLNINSKDYNISKSELQITEEIIKIKYLTGSGNFIVNYGTQEEVFTAPFPPTQIIEVGKKDNNIINKIKILFSQLFHTNEGLVNGIARGIEETKNFIYFVNKNQDLEIDLDSNLSISESDFNYSKTKKGIIIKNINKSGKIKINSNYVIKIQVRKD